GDAVVFRYTHTHTHTHIHTQTHKRSHTHTHTCAHTDTHTHTHTHTEWSSWTCVSRTLIPVVGTYPRASARVWPLTYPLDWQAVIRHAGCFVRCGSWGRCVG